MDYSLGGIYTVYVTCSEFGSAKFVSSMESVIPKAETALQKLIEKYEELNERNFYDRTRIDKSGAFT